MSKLNMFAEMSRNDDGSFRIVSKDEFTGKYESLKTTNGGDWCRESVVCRKYKMVTAKANGKFNLIPRDWHPTIEEQNVIDEFKKNCSFTGTEKGNYLKYFQIIGPNNSNINRQCWVKQYFIDNNMMVCVHCGTSSGDLEYDHKNDLYNDPRVFDKNTQTNDDIQILCKHCNDKKRSEGKKKYSSGKRVGASTIPALKPFGFDFTEGDESFDPKDPDALKGSYWYDPVKWITDAISIVVKKTKSVYEAKLERLEAENAEYKAKLEKLEAENAVFKAKLAIIHVRSFS